LLNIAGGFSSDGGGHCCTAAAYHTGGAHRQTFLPPAWAVWLNFMGRVRQHVAIAQNLHALQCHFCFSFGHKPNKPDFETDVPREGLQ
jgi:hypothetical protein